MSKHQLNYLSKNSLDYLYKNIATNLERYQTGDFQDYVERGGWSISLTLEIDPEQLSELDTTPGMAAEIENSIRVWHALKGMTPALACEDRIWTRLSHVEGLIYSRARWIKDTLVETMVRDIRTHFFAPTLSGARDDHSLARLWWNAKIAKDLRPDNQRGALELLLKTADIRSNLIERSQTLSRNKVGVSILNLMEQEPWLTKHMQNFRDFMKVVNRRGSGVVFELWSDSKVDEYLVACYYEAIGGSERGTN